MTYKNVLFPVPHSTKSLGFGKSAFQHPGRYSEILGLPGKYPLLPRLGLESRLPVVVEKALGNVHPSLVGVGRYICGGGFFIVN
jgi:hypothetical protein